MSSVTLEDLRSRSEHINETFLNAYSTGDVGTLREVCAEGFVARHTSQEELIEGVDEYADQIQTLRAAFPDLMMEQLAWLSDGSLFASHVRWTGTHEGELRGLPATGNRVSVEALVMAHLDDEGMLEQLWVFADDQSLLRQLGVMPGE